LESIELSAHWEHLVMRIWFFHDGDVASAVVDTFALVFGFFIDCIEDFIPSCTFGKCPSGPRDLPGVVSRPEKQGFIPVEPQI
jgi:hypothetical protein